MAAHRTFSKLKEIIMSKYTIYKIKCLINSKIYIGMTKSKIESRLRNHFSSSRKKSMVNHKFSNAILKHGKKNFIIETIDFADNIEIALIKESKYIKQFDSVKLGYNSSYGGQGGATNNKHADVSGTKNPMYGKHHSKETKKLISDKKLGKKPNKNTLTKLSKINKGENNNKSKLTEQQVIEIRRQYFDENKLQQDIANSFNVKAPCIFKICSYRTWKHL